MNRLFIDVHDIKHNHAVGIIDTVNHTGKFLVNEYINSLQQDSEIHIFCYDSTPEVFTQNLNLDKVKPHFHVCLPENFSQKDTDDLIAFSNSLTNLQCTSSKLVVIIDSFSTLLLEDCTHSAYRTIAHLTNQQASLGVKFQIQFLLIMHEDCLLNSQLEKISSFKYLCRAWFYVKKSEILLSKKKSSGKLLSSVFEYKYDNGKLLINKQTNISPVTMVSENKDNYIDSISTFKLTLSDNEKKDRDAVILPYERQSDDEQRGGGEIFYEGDDNDWDEDSD